MVDIANYFKNRQFEFYIDLQHKVKFKPSISKRERRNKKKKKKKKNTGWINVCAMLQPAGILSSTIESIY